MDRVIDLRPRARNELTKMCALMAEHDATHSELASFGEELRREREIRGISLKEISDATKISKRFLEAIERNDHRTLPAPVFTRGFVREYARYLGLSAEEMVTRYNYADRIEQSEHLERLVRPITPAEPKSIPRTRVDRNVVLLIVIVIALGLVTWWALRFKRDAREAALDSVSRTAIAAPITRSSVKVSAAPAAVTNTAAVNDDLMHMTIELTDDSWITLEADGKTVISDELKQGDRRTAEAHDRFKFKTIGNAGGVVLTLNDIQIPTLGKNGRVVHDRVFDRQWLKTHSPSRAEGAHTTP